jgi:hypothetical protein
MPLLCLISLDQVTKKTAIITPSRTLVDAYLAEIAKGYNIAWKPPSDDTDGASDGGVKACCPMLQGYACSAPMFSIFDELTAVLLGTGFRGPGCCGSAVSR